MTKRNPPAPGHLSAATRRWWHAVVDEYALEPHHLRLLQLAGEAWDRCVQARELIAKHGPTFTDRFGSPRKRPEISIEESARIAFARLCRELDLDVEPPASNRTGPPALRSNRR